MLILTSGCWCRVKPARTGGVHGPNITTKRTHTLLNATKGAGVNDLPIKGSGNSGYPCVEEETALLYDRKTLKDKINCALINNFFRGGGRGGSRVWLGFSAPLHS